jgi:hypothetical protein
MTNRCLYQLKNCFFKWWMPQKLNKSRPLSPLALANVFYRFWHAGSNKENHGSVVLLSAEKINGIKIVEAPKMSKKILSFRSFESENLANVFLPILT